MRKLSNSWWLPAPPCWSDASNTAPPHVFLSSVIFSSTHSCYILSIIMYRSLAESNMQLRTTMRFSLCDFLTSVMNLICYFYLLQSLQQVLHPLTIVCMCIIVRWIVFFNSIFAALYMYVIFGWISKIHLFYPSPNPSLLVETQIHVYLCQKLLHAKTIISWRLLL